MTNDERLDLAEECAKATRPDRKLDAKLHAAIGVFLYSTVTVSARPSVNCPGSVICYYEGGTHGTQLSPNYTANLDAALRLILPFDWHPSIVLRNAIDACIMAVDQDRKEFIKRLPLFLCAECLRAKEEK